MTEKDYCQILYDMEMLRLHQQSGCGSSCGMFVMFALFACLLSCRGSKPATEVVTSDRVQTKTHVYTVYVPETLFVEVPAQTAERTTSDSVSHLENDFALSDARINRDGTLSHTLETKPRELAVPFDKPVEHHDSVAVCWRIRQVTKTVTIRVKKPLTWIEQGLIWVGTVVLLAFVGWLLVWLARRFGK